MTGKILALGSKAPDFSLKDKDGKDFSLKDFPGKWVVLYFYPKDDTSGCTIEARDFSAQEESFVSLDAKVIGISPDSCESHENFSSKYDLSVLLLSDESHSTLEKYGAWVKKSNYGKEYWGVARTTYLINPEGRIEKVWENVAPEGHAKEVLEELKGRK